MIEESDLDLPKLMEKIKRTEDREKSRESELVELDDKRKLGIATLGSRKQHPRISAFRRSRLSCSWECDLFPCRSGRGGEAWFLGDLSAITAAYPQADTHVRSSYVNDSICGTWETLADAVFPGGAKVLSRKGWQEVGAEKLKWAEDSAPRMTIEDNRSPSFCFFGTRFGHC